MKSIKNKLEFYLNLEYTIRLKRNSDGSYFAEIEELPGCMTEGDTEEEALKMVEDAKKAWIETALDRAIKIPEPLRDDFSGKFNVRVPKYLHRKLAYKAREENVSLNTLITSALATVVE